MKAPLTLTNYICNSTLLFSFLLSLIFSTSSLSAQQKAFPTAYGGGAYANGGRGGNVYHVTSLADDGSTGTLRWAIGRPRPATIVFDVSGVIDIQDWMDIGGSNLTIAGQSAPVGGITIASTNGSRFRFRSDANNIVMRYIRVRPATQSPDDAFELFADTSINNIIIDHCSISYGGDETISVRGANTYNITFQRLIVAEGKTGSLFGDSGIAENSWNLSYLNNLNFNVSHRNPNSTSNGRVDIINNVVHDWQQHIGAFFGDIQLNLVNNFLSTGSRNSVIGTGVRKSGWSLRDTDDPRAHVSGNVADIPGSYQNYDFTDPSTDNQPLVWQWYSGNANEFRENRLDPQFFVDNMYPQIGAPMPLQTAEEAYADVINDAGANASLNADGSITFHTDLQDSFYLGILAQGQGAFHPYEMYDQVRTWWTDPMYAEFQAFVNAQGATPLNTRAADFYGASSPHIPEVWFQANVPAGQNFNDVAPSGYTWIEEYLNSVDTASAISAEGLTVTPETQTINIPETFTLTVTFTPENTTNKSGVWESSDEAIATVSNNGNVTPVAEGEATISFTSNDGGFSDSSVITVTNIITDIESIEVNPSNILLDIGETEQAIVTFTPSNATYQEGSWTSANPAVATVNPEGQITGVTEGITTITFTTDDGEFFGTVDVTVEDVFFGTYEFFNAATDEFIQNITGDTSFDLNEIGNEVNFRSIPQGGDGNTDVESVNVQWTGPENGTWTESIPIYAGMANHSDDFLSFDSYIVSEGTYNFTVTYYDQNNGVGNVVSIDTFSLTFFLGNGVNANAGNDVSICEGESATLTASGGTNFLWDNGETTATITVSPTETTTYTVVVSNDEGVEETDEVVVTVNAIPVASVSPDQTICNGESVTLTAQGGNAYLWSNGETTASITVSPNTETQYTVEAISNGCSSIANTTVFVNESPDLSLTDNITIMAGNTISLTVSGADSYQWNTGDTVSSIEISPTQTTVYSVTGFIGDCEQTAEVTVTVLPELDANAGEDVSICEGESVSLNASGGINYEWSTGATSSSITVTPSQTTTYTLIVSDNQGNTDTDTVIVTVNTNPNVSAGQNQTLVSGASTTLTAQGAESYIWNTGETTQSIDVSPTQTTTYTVTGITNSCEAQAQVTVTVEEVFTTTAGEDRRVCENDDYQIQLTAGDGDSYLWNTGETTQSITVSPLSTSTYSVIVTQGIQEATDEVTVFVDPNPNVVIANGNSLDILSGDFVTLSASGANTYQWNNGATQPNIAVSPSETTTFEVRGFVGDCYDEKQIVINVYQPVSAYAGEDISICLGETTLLEASGGDEYLWSTGETTESIEVSPTETTDYTVTVFNALDFDEATVRVEVEADCNIEPIGDPSDEELDFGIEIWPNPANNVVNVRIAGRILVSNVSIYDISGKLILQNKINNENLMPTVTQQIDISALTAGIYIVKLIDGENNITKKLIVN